MLQPKRQKYRKMHRGRRRGEAQRGATVAFGEFGLQAMQCGWLTSRQIEAARRAITHYIKRGGKIWIRIFPDHPVTTKPAETRMGSGKGAVDHYIAVVKPGRVLFEVGGLKKDLAQEAMRLAGYKLPIHTRFVVREDLGALSGVAEGDDLGTDLVADLGADLGTDLGTDLVAKEEASESEG